MLSDEYKFFLWLPRALIYIGIKVVPPPFSALFWILVEARKLLISFYQQ